MIKNNPQTPIRGDVLREVLLDLNRDAYGGELDFRNGDGYPLEVSDITDTAADGFGSESLCLFLAEWYGGGAYPFGDNCYVPIYSGAEVVAYMLVRKARYKGEEAVVCFFLGNTAAWLDFTEMTIWVKSADFEDSPLVEMRYRSGVLEVSLPPAETSYDSRPEMLGALGLNGSQYQALLRGDFHSVRNRADGHIYQVMYIQPREEEAFVMVGYRTPYVTQIWALAFADLEIIPIKS